MSTDDEIPEVDEPSLSAKVFNVTGIIAIHVGVLIAIYRGVDAGLIAGAVLTYVIRMFAITGGYHRYFSHRTYRTSRVFQFILALIGTSATQKGPLWWAAHHRHHHRYSDTEKDLHSPKMRGFWYSHIGWWLESKNDATRLDQIRDFAKYPELRWVDHYHWVGLLVMWAMCFAWRGFDGFLWAYVVSTCALLHGTFTINSLSHVFGTRRFETKDTSRNNLLLAFISLGEGWHNNHHYFQTSCRQGFYWWEIDVTYYILKVLSWVGIVWDIRQPTERVLALGRGELVPARARELETTPAELPVAAQVALGDAE